MSNITDILLDRIVEKDAPVVVGLDPMLSYIPEHIVKEAFNKTGENLEGAAEAVITFNKGLIDVIADIVPAVKPQIAMYEQFGVPGLQAFKETVDYAREKGLVVIGDIKRGDIGSTSAAYSTAHLGAVDIAGRKIRAFDEDYATVNPYLGSDGITPFLDDCGKYGKGVFVLVKTSNPSSGELQDLMTEGVPLYEKVAALVDSWGRELMGEKYPYSAVGAVVGATYPKIGASLRQKMPHTVILVPGYGAQGGTAQELKPYFNSDGLGAIVNSSRGIICAWKKKDDPEYGAIHYAEAAREAALDMIKDINGVR